MSPIFVRPVREQFEHDRLIRFLQAKYKRKAPVIAINVGDEQLAPVKLGTRTFFPDIVLWDGKKLAGMVEVETGESVNHLEAMAQWVHFAKARTPFHLYVPVQAFEVARRLCAALNARVTEVWTYRPTHEGFDLVRMVHDPTAPGAQMGTVAAAPARTAKPPKPPGPVKQPVKPAAKPAKAARPAASATKKPAARKTAGARPADRPAAKPKTPKTPKTATRAASGKTPARARKAPRKR